MTLDEAHLILNVKRGETLENVLKVNSYFFVTIFPNLSRDFFLMTVTHINHHDRIMSTYLK